MSMSIMFNIYVLVIILIILLGLAVWLVLVKFNCDAPIGCPSCPRCPPSPIFPNGLSMEGCVKNAEDNAYMKDMIRYLTLILKRYEAEKELYVLSNGYAQVYNSPKMDYLKKELHRMLKTVKENPKELAFFEKNLNNVIE